MRAWVAVGLLWVGCGGNGGGPDGGGVLMAGQGIFPSSSPWYTDVSAAPLASDSATVIQGVQNHGGWGLGNDFRIDFSFEVLAADASVARKTFTQSGDFYDPDCDPAPIPFPSGGRVEGETGYACTQDGDCHLLVVQGTRLYEMWRTDLMGNTLNGGCQAIWDLTKDVWTPAPPPNFSRGDGCSSADAGGFPITPLLFSADEVKAGTIAHAIRFILPNDRIRDKKYVHPATHSTQSPNGASGGNDTPPYGAHWRLRAGFDEASLPSEGARVVARALKKYGMFLADGGQVALTAQNDTYTNAKWPNLLDAHDLKLIKVTDFEMVDSGTVYTWGVNGSTDCNRTQITN